ncbi:MAG: hypothetical protein GDA46_05750 [Bdellovibrionales bacterium]|nr:hypothetical protein [Bdellovibrionales bacterium]
MSKVSLCFFLFLFPFPVFSYIKQEEIPSPEKSFEIRLKSEFFRSYSNYTKSGDLVYLSDNFQKNSFQYILIQPQLSYFYPFKKTYAGFSLFADSYNAKSHSQKSGLELPFKLSVLGGRVQFFQKIQSLFIGFRLTGAYSFHHVKLNPDTKELNLSSPQQTQDNEIIVGDHASYFEPTLSFIFKPSPNFHIYNQNSFRYRSSNLSSLFSLNLGTVFHNSAFSIGSSIDTFFSFLRFDDYTNRPGYRHEHLKKVNAGSFKFYSINPSVISFTLWTGLNFSPFQMTFYVNKDTWGKNYGEGITLGLITKFKWKYSKKIFLEEKRKKKKYLDFNSRNSNYRIQEKKETSYFEEEEDPYSENKNINLELQKELNLLNEEE